MAKSSLKKASVVRVVYLDASEVAYSDGLYSRCGGRSSPREHNTSLLATYTQVLKSVKCYRVSRSIQCKNLQHL